MHTKNPSLTRIRFLPFSLLQLLFFTLGEWSFRQPVVRTGLEGKQVLELAPHPGQQLRLPGDQRPQPGRRGQFKQPGVWGVSAAGQPVGRRLHRK